MSNKDKVYSGTLFNTIRRLRQTWFTRCIPKVFALAALTGCGSSDYGNPPDLTQPSMIAAPTPMSIYPVAGTSENPARLFIFVAAVGSQAVNMPLAFDTGSAGITLNALDIFPSSIVTSNGFVFESNQTSVTYQGIVVTNQQGTRSYGGTAGKTEYGNIGYATVAFGDSAGMVTTTQMPVFLYYAVTDNATGQAAAPQTQQGWFGVNSAPDAIVVPGTPATAEYPACMMGVSGTCYVASVLKYLNYATAVNAGFALSPTPLKVCDITAASCTPTAALTVGLASATKDGFTQSFLTCALNYAGPLQINGYNVCSPAIPQTTITVSGSGGGSIQTNVIYDTGTPFFALNIPNGVTFPSALSTGASLQVMMSSGFMYAASVGSGVDAVQVADLTAAQSANPADISSVIGLGYFTTNSFFIDFTAGTEGWK